MEEQETSLLAVAVPADGQYDFGHSLQSASRMETVNEWDCDSCESTTCRRKLTRHFAANKYLLASMPCFDEHGVKRGLEFTNHNPDDQVIFGKRHTDG